MPSRQTPIRASDEATAFLALMASRIKSRSEYQAYVKCPAHNDGEASLSVAAGQDGRLILKCHAGCSFEAVMEASRFQRDSFKKAPAVSSGPKVEGELQATYDYVDENGEVKYQVLRYMNPKGFRQRRLVGENPERWAWNLHGVTPLLYRLPEVIEAASMGKTIFVVEGEKDVHNLEYQGLIATTNSGGSGKWRDDFSSTLSGATVVLVPDNDEAGEKHARTVAESLARVGGKAKVVWLEDLEDHEDVSDWLVRGGTGEALAKLAENAPYFLDAPTRPVLPSRSKLASEIRDRALKRIALDTSKFPRFPVKPLHDLTGLLAPDDLVVIGARQGDGKSLLSQNIAKWLYDQEHPSLYMGTEQDPHVLVIKQACIEAGIPPRLILKPTPEEKQTKRYIEAKKAVDAMVEYLTSEKLQKLLHFSNNRYIDRKSLETWTENAVRNWGVRTVFVDHVHHMDHGDGKNPVHELTKTIHLSKDLAVKHGITMILAAQLKRPLGDWLLKYMPPQPEDFGGASAIERTADLALGLWRPLKQGIKREDLQIMKDQIASGALGEDSMYQQHIMGIKLLKDRLGNPGKAIKLQVANGVVGEIGTVIPY